MFNCQTFKTLTLTFKLFIKTQLGLCGVLHYQINDQIGHIRLEYQYM